MEQKYKYIQAPLCLVSEIYKDRNQGIEMIGDYGIYHFVERQKPDEATIVRQLIYDYYRNPNRLSGAMIREFEMFEHIDEDYQGFTPNGDFQPPDELLQEVRQVLNESPKLFKEAEDSAKWHATEEFFKDHITIYDRRGVSQSYNEALKIKKRYEAENGKDASFSVKPTLLSEFKNNPEKDIHILTSYLGILSMIGRRNFISTNKPAILSRMIGAKSKAVYQSLSSSEAVKETVKRYSGRYQMDKLLMELVKRKFIMFLSKKPHSVIYVSRYMEPNELEKLIHQARSKNNIKKQMRDASASL